jgi:hypothetical protein
MCRWQLQITSRNVPSLMVHSSIPGSDFDFGGVQAQVRVNGQVR